jgi:pyridoxal phosphate phosphatase PHOSPHO2
MVKVVVVMDFDRTIIDDDSDRWVINEMGLTDFFNKLRSTIPSWTSLMDTIMKELHSKGITIENIAHCLQRAFLHPNIASAIKSAQSLGYVCVLLLFLLFLIYICARKLFNLILFFRCDLRIISDANLFYIETILEHHNLLGCFSEINTNPTFVDEKGCLHVTPFHDSTTLPPHACQLCPPNMCKVYSTSISILQPILFGVLLC